MDDVSSFVVALADSLPTGAGDPSLGVEIGVTEVELTLPIEARFTVGCPLELSTPRGRMHTGFWVEHGRIKLLFTRDVMADSRAQENGPLVGGHHVPTSTTNQPIREVARDLSADAKRPCMAQSTDGRGGLE